MGPPRPSRRAQCEGIICRKRVGVRPPQDEAEDKPSTTRATDQWTKLRMGARRGDWTNRKSGAAHAERPQSQDRSIVLLALCDKRSRSVDGKLFFVRRVGTMEAGGTSG